MKDKELPMKKILTLIVITLALLAGCKSEPITREELITMIEAGEDVTRVNTSEITDMSGLFKDNKDFNQDISRWDVSNVTDMSNMFYEAKYFNQDISRWDVSRVTDMSNMFYGAYSFNADLSTWDVSLVAKNYKGFNRYCALIWENCPSFLPSFTHQEVGEIINVMENTTASSAPEISDMAKFISTYPGWEVPDEYIDIEFTNSHEVLVRPYGDLRDFIGPYTIEGHYIIIFINSHGGRYLGAEPGETLIMNYEADYVDFEFKGRLVTYDSSGNKNGPQLVCPTLPSPVNQVYQVGDYSIYKLERTTYKAISNSPLRYGPGLNFSEVEDSSILYFFYGKEVSVIGRTTTKDTIEGVSDYWYYVACPYDGEPGELHSWVFGSELKPVD
ncbi:MAG: BspA family leucine-rich repeat surface protein [Spirochaetaceae bacterium]